MFLYTPLNAGRCVHGRRSGKISMMIENTFTLLCFLFYVHSKRWNVFLQSSKESTSRHKSLWAGLRPCISALELRNSCRSCLGFKADRRVLALLLVSARRPHVRLCFPLFGENAREKFLLYSPLSHSAPRCSFIVKVQIDACVFPLVVLCSRPGGL